MYKKSFNEENFETTPRIGKWFSKSIISFKLIDSIKEVISHEKNDEKIILLKNKTFWLKVSETMASVNCPLSYCRPESCEQLLDSLIEKFFQLIQKSRGFDDLFSKYLLFEKLCELPLNRLVVKEVYEKLIKLRVESKIAFNRELEILLDSVDSEEDKNILLRINELNHKVINDYYFMIQLIEKNILIIEKELKANKEKHSKWISISKLMVENGCHQLKPKLCEKYMTDCEQIYVKVRVVLISCFIFDLILFLLLVKSFLLRLLLLLFLVLGLLLLKKISEFLLL
jgi:hypothetical protein